MGTSRQNDIMNQQSVLTELYPLSVALFKWCEFLSQNNYSNFSENFQVAFDQLREQFGTDERARYEALLSFQDVFKGGMGSINDISIDDLLFREAVEKESDLLINRYYALVFSR